MSKASGACTGRGIVPTCLPMTDFVTGLLTMTHLLLCLRQLAWLISRFDHLSSMVQDSLLARTVHTRDLPSRNVVTHTQVNGPVRSRSCSDRLLLQELSLADLQKERNKS